MKNTIMPYAVYSPGGNITALVSALTGERGGYAAMAKKIIAARPAIEQVGFLEPPRRQGCDFHLEMMGGEFCGNAGRCAAYHFLKSTGNRQTQFTISGFALPVAGIWEKGRVGLNIPQDFFVGICQNEHGWLVDFQGIRFLAVVRPPEQDYRALIGRYRVSFPAMGIVEMEERSGGCRIHPWVWVGSTGTFTAETACASGSLAAALVLREQGRSVPVYGIVQPSGARYEVVLSGAGGCFSLFGKMDAIHSDIF